MKRCLPPVLLFLLFLAHSSNLAASGSAKGAGNDLGSASRNQGKYF
jgi:predicted small secreted protein